MYGLSEEDPGLGPQVNRVGWDICWSENDNWNTEGWWCTVGNY